MSYSLPLISRWRLSFKVYDVVLRPVALEGQTAGRVWSLLLDPETETDAFASWRKTDGKYVKSLRVTLYNNVMVVIALYCRCVNRLKRTLNI